MARKKKAGEKRQSGKLFLLFEGIAMIVCRG